MTKKGNAPGSRRGTADEGPRPFCFSLFRFQYSIVSFRMQSRKETKRAFSARSARGATTDGQSRKSHDGAPLCRLFQMRDRGFRKNGAVSASETSRFFRQYPAGRPSVLGGIATDPGCFPFCRCRLCMRVPVCTEPVRPLTNGRPSDRMRSYRDGGRAAFSACFLYIDTSCIMCT